MAGPNACWPRCARSTGKLAHHAPVEKRTGKDGKARRLPMRRVGSPQLHFRTIQVRRKDFQASLWQAGACPRPISRVLSGRLVVTPWAGGGLEEGPMLGIRRREFITLLGCATAWPVAARAQVSPKRPTIAWLSGGSPQLSVSFIENFLRGMRELGYVEGRNFEMLYRFTDGYQERLPALTEEVIRRGQNIAWDRSRRLADRISDEDVSVGQSQDGERAGHHGAADAARPR
jgi:hypothetical protein